MNLNADPLGRRVTLEAQTKAEAAWLAAVVRVVGSGGELVIRPKGEPETVVEFDGCLPAPAGAADAGEVGG